MRKLTLSLLSFTLGISVMPFAQAAPGAQQQLLEQVRLGETTKREDLVRQSLYRLELMAPDDPDVIAARLRYLLRQGDNAGAQKQMARLNALAPNASATKASRITMALSTPEGRQALQEARLQAATGHPQEAVAAYEKMFNGSAPAGDLAAEYWIQVAKVPARHNEAITQLKALNASNPGNTDLQSTLARLLIADGRNEEGYAVLEQMAKNNTGRDAAANLWYQQIQGMAVSEKSVAALKRFLSVFSEGDTVVTARQQLDAQQKQLADPAFRERASGLAAVEAGKGGTAIGALQDAVSKNHQDSEAVGALGQAYSQKGDRARAVAQFERAIALDPNSDNRGKWDSLLKVNRYWLLIQQGDAQLAAKNPAQA